MSRRIPYIMMSAQHEALLSDLSVTSDELVKLALGYNCRTTESVAMHALDILVERGDIRDVNRVGCTYNNRHDKVMRRAWRESWLMSKRAGEKPLAQT